jgi:hypothetical protein
MSEAKFTPGPLKAYEEATASAHRADVPNHSWNGESIFKNR